MCCVDDYFMILFIDTRGGGNITEEDMYSTHGTSELIPTATQQGEFVWKPLNWIACIVDCFLSVYNVGSFFDFGVGKHLDKSSQSPGENPLVSSVAVL